LLGHSNSCISQDEGVGGLVRNNVYLEGGLVTNNVRVSKGLVPNLVKGVGGIGDKFSEEDLLVGVEGVDDQAHQLLDVSVEGEVLSRLFLAHF
jgi:hypothetical protein